MESNASVSSESKHNTSVNLGLAADSLAQPDYDMASEESVRGLNANQEWENRHPLFSSNIFVKFITGRTVMIGITDAMRIQDLVDRVMERMAELQIHWPYDDGPRLVYCGRCLQAAPDAMFLTCAYQSLWAEAVIHAFPPINQAQADDNDEEDEEGEEEEESEEEEQAN